MLEELQNRYNQFYKENNFNISPTTWNNNSSYIQNSFNMNFRGDNAYVWQCKLGDNFNTYIEYYKILKKIDKDNLFAKTKEDGSYGCISFEIDNIQISRDLLDSILEIYFLQSIFPNLHQMNILEIGAGYGRLCKRFTDCFPSSKYFITDAIPESTYFSKIYLGKENENRVINLFDIENKINSGTINLAINIHSFPECNIDDIEWWVKFIYMKKIKYIFYVPNNPNSTPDYMPTNRGASILEIYCKYGYKVKEFKNVFNDLNIKYSYSVPFFILENNTF
jgi:putative sugar O-methyltransferase